MKILIIGESCVDEYIFGRCDRVCPEAAALCFQSHGDIHTNLGMAGNVLNNIRTIRPDYKIDIITNVDSTIIKRRFIDNRYNTIVFRHDINDTCKNIDINIHNFSGYDGVIFSDYCKGFLSESDISSIITRLDKQTISFIDTKKYITDFIKGIHFLKINNKEFRENMSDLNKIRSICDIIITKGDLGATHITSNTETVYPTQKINIRDVCGAGDTFLAAFAVKYLEDHNVASSITYANQCAGNVVSKFGVCTP